jgi:NAD(P)-dependent dehydrogenase (short-subunit alcohol dehydrogenase family)
MLLKDKIAVVYGAGGNIGGTVARAFAADGARLYLVGRTRARLERTAADIAAAGGTARSPNSTPPTRPRSSGTSMM